MGLIKAAMGAAGGVMADQWKEYFYCESLPADVLVAKGMKRTSGRSSNTKGSENIISNGSVIAVADGQCMIIVEQGKVVDVCAESGEYTYDMSTEPSLFCGSLSQTIPAVFKNIGKRFTFGGEAPKDQRVYYVNTKELMGNKYGTPNPVPFKVFDPEAGIPKMMINIKCFGEYSYRITNPILFYTNVCGNVDYEYGRESIDSQLKSELLTALQPALARIAQQKIMYDELPLYTKDIAKALNIELSEDWAEGRGIEIVNFGVSSVTATPEDEARIKKYQDAAILTNPALLNATMGNAMSDAMLAAANNQSGMGAMGAFMGMNMAAQTGMGAMGAFAGSPAAVQQGAQQIQQAQQQAMQPQQAAPAAGGADAWTCSCGAQNTGKFCANCGSPKPAPAPAPGAWTCSCGTQNTGNFCANCGSPKPAAPAGPWTCSCGTQNEGKFCANCGSPRP